jgi:predicted CoA-substrate-specific enzyme activase
MITAGIDMGMECIKIVILKDGKIIGRGKGISGGARRLAAAEAALREALREAELPPEAIEKTVATGKGKFDLPFVSDRVTEPITTAAAARALVPDATFAVDAGADETLCVSLRPDGSVSEMVQNEKCAAGIGSFLRKMARRLELSPEEMSALPPVAAGGPRVNDGCVVFAELDALSLLNHGVTPREIASACTDAAACRAGMTINDITVPDFTCVVLLGGLTKNKAFVRDLKTRSKLDLIVPAEAEYAGALGAALVAAREEPVPAPHKEAVR